MRLPQFPDCEVEIHVRSRTCNEGTEVAFQWIDWRVTNDPNDTSDPCHVLHEAYLSSAPGQDLFLRDLYNYGLQAYTDYHFNRNYTFDSLKVIVYPDNPKYRQDLADRKCPAGITVFRVTHAQCMVAIARSYEESRARDRDPVQPNTLMSDSDHIAERMRVRYAPCDAQISYCCTRRYKICRDTSTHQNVRTLAFTPSSQHTCPPGIDTTMIHPPVGQDEWIVGACIEYCQ